MVCLDKSQNLCKITLADPAQSPAEVLAYYQRSLIAVIRCAIPHTHEADLYLEDAEAIVDVLDLLEGSLPDEKKLHKWELDDLELLLKLEQAIRNWKRAICRFRRDQKIEGGTQNRSIGELKNDFSKVQLIVHFEIGQLELKKSQDERNSRMEPGFVSFIQLTPQPQLPPPRPMHKSYSIWDSPHRTRPG